MAKQGPSDSDSAAEEIQPTSLLIIGWVCGDALIGMVVGGLVGFANPPHDRINVAVGAFIGLPVGLPIGGLLFVLWKRFGRRR
jgi:hypothetical protein